MPLMHSKSKKAFSANVKAERDSGKPMNQSLAIAYSVKRKAKKASGGTVESGSKDMNMSKGGMAKYAEGGEITAKNEKRPMPDQKFNDSESANKNDRRKSISQGDWTDNPTVKQAQSNNGRMVKPIKHPSMVQSPVFKARLRDEEDDLQSSSKPGPYGEQPREDENEEGPDRQGDKISDMSREHSNGRKPYEMEVEHDDSMDEAEPDMKQKMAKGGMINKEVSMQDAEEDMDEHPEGEEMDDDSMRPPEDEYMSNHFASGGEVDPEEEMAIEHAASIVAAIMAKRKMMARGGEILSEDSMDSDDSDMVDLSRNAEEDANMEDKASFDALRKENYSESDALDDADQPEDSNEHSPEHDEEDINDRSIVGAIRRKMKKKSPISR